MAFLARIAGAKQKNATSNSTASLSVTPPHPVGCSGRALASVRRSFTSSVLSSSSTSVRQCSDFRLSHVIHDGGQLSVYLRLPSVSRHDVRRVPRSPRHACGFQRSISHQGFQSGNTRIRACRSSIVTGAPAMKAGNRDMGMRARNATRSEVRPLRTQASSSCVTCRSLSCGGIGDTSVTARATASSAAPA